MAVSSKSILHYTDSLDNLKGILTLGGLIIKYCNEKVTFSGKGAAPGAFPMVCFCDLPLTLAKDHIGKYGSYGIGFSKEWARKNQLNPVIYLEQESSLSLHLMEQSNRLVRKGTESEVEEEARRKAVQEFARIIAFCKNHVGPLVRKGKTVDSNYVFYDEREWRYVPSLEVLGDAPLVIATHRYESKKSEYNEMLENKNLPFSYKDISYIIVKNEGDIPEVADCIHGLYYKTLPQPEYQQLYTKIISVTQIHNDF